MAYATPSSDLNHPSNKVLLELVLSHVCKKHGLNRFDFRSASTNPTDDDVTLTFNGIVLPPKFNAPVGTMKDLMTDQFRGPIIKSAVPEFFAAAQRMMQLLEQMQNPYTIRVTRAQIDNLIRKP